MHDGSDRGDNYRVVRRAESRTGASKTLNDINHYDDKRSHRHIALDISLKPMGLSVGCGSTELVSVDPTIWCGRPPPPRSADEVNEFSLSIPKRSGHHPSRSHYPSSFVGALLSYISTERNLVQGPLARHTQIIWPLGKVQLQPRYDTAKHAWDAMPPSPHVVPPRDIKARDDFWDTCDAVYAMGCESPAEYVFLVTR
ncbi:hypothetical protein BV22DRAFT_1129037 [Leucogyrophana mollusca]|uniref:Uncharacterized protein n=1 Tax=Leucogyrophana mollusca TaxID=85980 RepID=A0ACB8BKK5_9AGAM|nr:hypothetical protein BV22DRAFT_1129037 [Leucogyrophana mollusca]